MAKVIEADKAVPTKAPTAPAAVPTEFSDPANLEQWIDKCALVFPVSNAHAQ